MSMGNTSAMTLDDYGLLELTDILANFERLESLSLVGNTKLGMTGRTFNGARALRDFMGRVGRKLKVRPLVKRTSSRV